MTEFYNSLPLDPTVKAIALFMIFVMALWAAVSFIDRRATH